MRSAKHHPGRRAPWKRPGYAAWSDAPALPPVSVPGAAIAAPGTVPDDLRSYQVAVSRRRRGGYEAFTRFCVGWEGLCVHGVSATSGEEAKALGIAEHVRLCVHGAKETR